MLFCFCFMRQAEAGSTSAKATNTAVSFDAACTCTALAIKAGNASFPKDTTYVHASSSFFKRRDRNFRNVNVIPALTATSVQAPLPPR